MLHIYDALLPFSWHSWTFSRIHHFAPMLTQLIGLRCSLIRQSQPSERHLDRLSFLCLRLLESPISSTVQVFYLVLCLSSSLYSFSCPFIPSFPYCYSRNPVKGSGKRCKLHNVSTHCPTAKRLFVIDTVKK